MNLGNVQTRECLNVVPPPDARCADEAFRLLHPEVCGVDPVLIIKPGIALACVLGSIQFKAFVSRNGQEEDVTADTIWESSDLDIAVIGRSSGNATGVAAGDVIITATYGDLTTTATLSVLTVVGDDCCSAQHVAFMVLVDTSKSMSLAFGDGYATRLTFAKAAAAQFINEVNATKDTVGLASFNDAETLTLAIPTSNKTAVATLASAITQTQQKTSFYTALETAIATLTTTGADRQVILLISDGEDTTSPYTEDNNPLVLLSGFKAGGGIVMCLGTRASGTGFSLLSAMATGGFFINAYPPDEAASLVYLSGLKGYICGGNCTPEGDLIVGQGSVNYTGFLNWDVVEGTVDLVGNGYFDFLPGHGLYVDMRGTLYPQTGRLVSKTAYSLTAGHTYRVRFKLAGNQRQDLGTQTLRVRVIPSGGAPDLFSQDVAVASYGQIFTDYSLNFNVLANITANLSFNQVEFPAGEHRIGLLLDEIELYDVTDGTTLLFDDFDNENLVFVPPACGVSSLYPYVYGYNCYGEGCLDEPPPAQLPDPHPLNNIEVGYTPPRIYSSTQTACAECPEGYANYTVANEIPAMTGETTSGYSVTDAGVLASPSPPADVGYEPWHAFTGSGYWRNAGPTANCNITTPASVTGVKIRITPGPASYGRLFFVELFRTPPGPPVSPIVWNNVLFPVDGTPVEIPFTGPLSATACTGFYLAITAGDGGENDIKQVEILSNAVAGPLSVCEEATAESEISQQDAVDQARAAALALAEPHLNCVAVYTATESYTAHCPLGEFGADVTKVATYTSLISQQDADTQALALATAEANAALDCTGSNNAAEVTINDSDGSGPAAASPYPTVQHFSGYTGTITGMTVWLKNLSHGSPQDLVIVLRGPDGTTCNLMQRRGGTGPVSDLTLQISDDGAAMPDPLVSGHFQPSQTGVDINLPGPVEAAPYGTALSVFNGKTPNGSWSLWIADIATGDSGTLAEGWEIVFTTTGDTVLYALGDLKVEAAQQALVQSLAALLPATPTGFLMLGDVGGIETPETSWEDFWDWGFGDHVNKTLFTPGNHDWLSQSANAQQQTRNFWQGLMVAVYNGNFPASILTGDTADFNYAVKFGSWKVVVFNSEAVDDEPGALLAGGTVYEFLNTELAEAGYQCIVISHKPRWSGDVTHGDNASMDAVWRLAVQHKAVAWFAGHAHASEVQAQRDSNGAVVGFGGLAQIISGAGNINLYGPNGGYSAAAIQFRQSATQAMALLNLNDSGLTVHFITTAGATISGSTFRFPAK